MRHVKVLPDVWRMCAFTVCLSFLLCHIYNPIRRAVRDGQKKTLIYYLFQDCDSFFNMCTSFVTFILSFFNATVFTRWWKLRELCGTVNGKTVDTTVMLSAYIKRREDYEELLRLLWLAHALHVTSIDPLVTSDPEHAMERVLRGLREDGLIAAEECEALRPTTLATSTPLSIAYGWFTCRLRTAMLRDVPPSLHSGLLQIVQANISAMRGAASDVLMYLGTPMPLAYTQLLELMVTIYVLMAPLGLVPRLLWMAVPGCFVVTLVFYGFMSLGKLMLNPFAAASDDAFDTQAFLRGTRTACRAVADATFTKPPLGGAAAGEGGGDVTPAASRSLLQRCHTTAGLRNAGFFSVPQQMHERTRELDGVFASPGGASGSLSGEEEEAAEEAVEESEGARLKGPLLAGSSRRADRGEGNSAASGLRHRADRQGNTSPGASPGLGAADSPDLAAAGRRGEKPGMK